MHYLPIIVLLISALAANQTTATVVDAYSVLFNYLKVHQTERHFSTCIFGGYGHPATWDSIYNEMKTYTDDSYRTEMTDLQTYDLTWALNDYAFFPTVSSEVFAALTSGEVTATTSSSTSSLVPSIQITSNYAAASETTTSTSSISLTYIANSPSVSTVFIDADTTVISSIEHCATKKCYIGETSLTSTTGFSPSFSSSSLISSSIKDLSTTTIDAATGAVIPLPSTDTISTVASLTSLHANEGQAVVVYIETCLNNACHSLSSVSSACTFSSTVSTSTFTLSNTTASTISTSISINLTTPSSISPSSSVTSTSTTASSTQLVQSTTSALAPQSSELVVPSTSVSSSISSTHTTSIVEPALSDIRTTLTEITIAASTSVGSTVVLITVTPSNKSEQVYTTTTSTTEQQDSTTSTTEEHTTAGSVEIDTTASANVVVSSKATTTEVEITTTAPALAPSSAATTSSITPVVEDQYTTASIDTHENSNVATPATISKPSYTMRTFRVKKSYSFVVEIISTKAPSSDGQFTSATEVTGSTTVGGTIIRRIYSTKTFALHAGSTSNPVVVEQSSTVSLLTYDGAGVDLRYSLVLGFLGFFFNLLL